MLESTMRLFWLNWGLMRPTNVHRAETVRLLHKTDSIKPKANQIQDQPLNNRSSRLMQYPFYINIQIAFLHTVSSFSLSIDI